MRLLRRAHGNLPSANHGHGARDITSQLVGNKRAGVSRTRGVRSLTGRVVRADVASFAVLRSDAGIAEENDFGNTSPRWLTKQKTKKGPQPMARRFRASSVAPDDFRGTSQ